MPAGRGGLSKAAMEPIGMFSNSLLEKPLNDFFYREIR
jgi:hypothetical protein